MKAPKWKQYIAPIVITVLFVVYMIVYFALLVSVLSGIERVLFAVIPAALSALLIHVCVQRIKEIRSGEEDDLDNY